MGVPLGDAIIGTEPGNCGQIEAGTSRSDSAS